MRICLVSQEYPPETAKGVLARRALRTCLGVAVVPVVVLALFTLNGVVICDGTSPRSGITQSTVGAQRLQPEGIRLMAFNIAKCFVYSDGMQFASRAEVQGRLEDIAEIIRDSDSDLVCLSEIVRECAPCNINQVEYLAQRTGLTNWAFGECFSFGLPFCRVVSGNAIISRYPLVAVTNLTLAGRKPFYVTKNNRRALVCQITTDEGAFMLWSLHNDSFIRSNNLAQVRQLLGHPSAIDSFMAGDFNARPFDPSMLEIKSSGRFTGVFDGPNTFPSSSPTRTIDFVLAPTNWTVKAHSVITNLVSDHCAVLTVFNRKETGR
jgi:endonuclease/exonuclease/phosphatase family metal-dependent hydrolase